jgi:hypothetical protein
MLTSRPRLGRWRLVRGLFPLPQCLDKSVRGLPSLLLVSNVRALGCPSLLGCISRAVLPQLFAVVARGPVEVVAPALIVDAGCGLRAYGTVVDSGKRAADRRGAGCRVGVEGKRKHDTIVASVCGF